MFPVIKVLWVKCNMSGCHIPLTMGNLAYSPQYGGYCACPCHHALTPYGGQTYWQCYCNCRSYNNLFGGQPTVIYLENKIMEERIKKIEENIQDLQESYQGLSAELRYIMDNMNKKPHKCPVCDATGSIPPTRMICKTCEGKGIVWG